MILIGFLFSLIPIGIALSLTIRQYRVNKFRYTIYMALCWGCGFLWCLTLTLANMTSKCILLLYLPLYAHWVWFLRNIVYRFNFT